MSSASMKQITKETEKDKRSSEEIYQSIVARLKIITPNELTEQEAHEAARNLIGFCQEIIHYKIKTQKSKKCDHKTNE